MQSWKRKRVLLLLSFVLIFAVALTGCTGVGTSNVRGEMPYDAEADKAPCGWPSFEQFMVATVIPLEVSEADMSRLEKLYYEIMTIECSEEQDWTQFDALVEELGITWESKMVEICEILMLESFEELMAGATIPEGVTEADIQRLEQLYFETVYGMTGDMPDEMIGDWTRFDDLVVELGIEFNIRDARDVNSEVLVVEDVLIFNPAHLEVYKKLVNASSDLIAAGVPLVDFSQEFGTVDSETGFANIIILVGLREVKNEYKESIKAIVEGIEGVEFDFFQAKFTREEISGWQDDIWATFGNIRSRGSVSHTISSWGDQIITVRFAGEVQPQYIEAVRALVGNEAPLQFQGGESLPPSSVTEPDVALPDDVKEVWVAVFEQLFPELDPDILKNKVETEEFFKTLTPGERTQVVLVFLDHAAKGELVAPEERQGLEQEMMMWIEEFGQ